MKITKSKTSKYWLFLRKKLLDDMGNEKLWEEAYALFEERIDSRYLDYIKLIEDNGNKIGEGFAIMSIYCSLIEFLETTIQGLNFQYKKKKDLLDFEYGNGHSKSLFTSFLTKRKPFLLTEEIAASFYENVRCGLLHEAQTTNGWIIRVDTVSLITQKNENYILNRSLFSRKIKQFLLIYKANLIKNEEFKKAFIRKFNHLCLSN